jgi:hypothetical protein
MNITVLGYNRPAYLERTLSALSRCDGIEDCKVFVMFDPSDMTDRQMKIAEKYGFSCGVAHKHVGCNVATAMTIEYGFQNLGGEDFHVHFEDDTVPTRDCLRWFAWARDTYRDFPEVMNVSGYQRLSNGKTAECGLRRWFTPWGWGVWRDRWLGLLAGWAQEEEHSWDTVVNHVLRGGRYEVFPTVSRIQNIGALLGTHVPDADWHAANHRVPITADDLAGAVSSEWMMTRRVDYADHG